MRKIVSIVITAIFLALLMPIAAISANEIGKYMGLVKISVPVVGTGSMYPSLYWTKAEGGPDDDKIYPTEEYRSFPHMFRRFTGISLFGKTYFKREINRGDMVSFRNDATSKILSEEGKDNSSGFIKRIVGMPGDVVELRDGFVYINGQELAEPYIYKPRSTYGDVSLPDCQKLVVPEGKYFVMGDNRKTSSDSRGELGLISDQDIYFTLPLSEQKVYLSLWRDTSHDGELSGTPTLSTEEFYKLLNSTRVDRSVSILKEDKRLANSSVASAKHMLEGDTNYSLKKFLQTAGYSNVLSAEFVSRGHFSAEELLQNLLSNPESARVVLDSQYSDIGLGTVNQEINGCPAEIVVGHLGGYIPAEYEPQVVNSWGELLSNLDSVIPSWQEARSYDNIDQSKVDELLTILYRRRNFASEIHEAMKNKEWLTEDQQNRIEQDSADAARAEQLVSELNKGN